MAIYVWVKIGACIGLLPDDAKPLPEQFSPIKAVLCHSPEDNFIKSTHELKSMFQNYTFKIITRHPGANELMINSSMNI